VSVQFLAGSTNWTDTGLCGQSNNAVVIENADLAAAYLAYWNRLREDTPRKPGAENC
jgi:phosphatidylserine/phosphatidylglycerophosphate/cardiolipin synthase-like enzyme